MDRKYRWIGQIVFCSIKYHNTITHGIKNTVKKTDHTTDLSFLCTRALKGIMSAEARADEKGRLRNVVPV